MVPCSRGVLVLLAVTASACDLTTGKVPNWLLLPTLLCGILLRGLSGGPPGLLSATGGMLIVTVVLFPFWKHKGLGAGDIKMLAILSFFLEGERYLMCLLFSFLAGALFALLSWFRHRDFHRSLPFAVPIGTGILLCLLLEQAGIRYYS